MIEAVCLSAIVLIAIGVGYTFFRGWVLLLVIGGLILCCTSGIPAVLWTTGIVLATAWGSALAKLRPALFWGVATVAACLPYAVVAPSLIAQYREVRQLREKYPVESLAGRLAYEEPLRKEAQSSAPRRVDMRRNKSAVEDRFDRELNARVIPREGALMTLHEVHAEYESAFMGTEGFGDERMPRMPPRREYIELPEPEPIPVVPDSEQDSTPAPESSGATEQADAKLADDQLSGFHADGVVDFARPEGFGAVVWGGKELERIGFQAHAFRHRPQFPQRRGTKWKIEQLQLVGILKHDTPAAYESENLPRMEELREARTRPLTEFEQSALEQLHAGEDLVVHETRDTIEMLGALRALSVCTQCHQVPQQTLLGAFTYRLRRPTPQGPKSTL